MPDGNERYKKQPRPESIEMLIRYLKGRNYDILKIDDQVILIKRKNKSDLKVYMTNIYHFAFADLEEVMMRSGINAIVSMSDWNSYTNEAKEMAKSRGVGLFTFKEFLGAVNYEGHKFLNYQIPRRA